VGKKLYRADRDFDHFRMGEVVELDEDNPYVNTGYLEEWEPQEAPEVEPVPSLASTTVRPETGGDGAAPAQGTPAEESTAADAPADGPAEEDASGDGEGAGTARPRTRSRSRE
jgi:hypothetical protein